MDATPYMERASSSSLQHSVRGLEPGKSYVFVVRAENEAGPSVNGAEVLYTPKSAAVGAVAGDEQLERSDDGAKKDKSEAKKERSEKKKLGKKSEKEADSTTGEGGVTGFL